MRVQTRTQAESLQTVDDLLSCLRSASQRYDRGRPEAARSLARYLRALLGRADGSDALDGLRDKLTWVDTAGVANPKTPCSISRLTLMSIRSRHHGAEEYVPKLAMYPPVPIRTRSGDQIFSGSRIPFQDWWTNPVVTDADGSRYSRKQLVLAMSGEDDPEAEAARMSLEHSESLGWVLGEPGSRPLCGSPVVASIRQIAYEVLQSIAEQRDVIDASG